MARTEKVAFWILIFLLIVGVAAKFYKLEKDVPNLKLPPRAAAKEHVKPQKAELSGKPAKIRPHVPKILDLNSASAQDLALLPHMGMATAEKIVAYRAAQGPFKEKTDILRVDGISISRYKQIELFVRVE